MKVSTLKKANDMVQEISQLDKMRRALERPHAKAMSLYTGNDHVEVGKVGNLGQTLLDIACAEVSRQIVACERQFKDLQDDPNDPEDG